MRIVLTAFFIGLFTLTASAADVVNGVVAIVNDKIITHGDVWKDLEIQLEQMERRYRDPQVFEQKLREKQEEITERLVERNLILHEFKVAGYVLPESALDDAVNDHVKRVFGDRATMAKTLRAQGKTMEAFREEIRMQIVESEMRKMHIDREILISPHKIENYYIQHRDQYKVGDQVKVRMITLNQTDSKEANYARDLALQIAGRIKGGTAFAEMASLYSEADTKSKGGDYGWVNPTTLIKPLTDAAFELDANQLGPVIGLARPSKEVVIACYHDASGKIVKTRRYENEAFIEEKQGAPASDIVPKEYYLILTEDKRVAFSKPLAEVRDEIEKQLRQEEREKARQRWIEKLKKKSFVRYF